MHDELEKIVFKDDSHKLLKKSETQCVSALNSANLFEFLISVAIGSERRGTKRKKHHSRNAFFLSWRRANANGTGNKLIDQAIFYFLFDRAINCFSASSCKSGYFSLIILIKSFDSIYLEDISSINW